MAEQVSQQGFVWFLRHPHPRGNRHTVSLGSPHKLFPSTARDASLVGMQGITPGLLSQAQARLPPYGEVEAGHVRKGHRDLKGSGKEGPCRHCSRSHQFPLCTTGKGPSLRPAGGTLPPLGPVERAPPPHTPHRLMSLRGVGTPGTRNHHAGSIFHTLSRCSYWTVPRPPRHLLRPHAQSSAVGLARRGVGAVARGARPPSRRAW